MSSVELELNEEQESLYSDIQKGNALKQLKACQGWEILSETLEALRDQATNELVNTPPGDTDTVRAAHAVAYAVARTIDNLRSAVDEAILQADKYAPERLQEIETVRNARRFNQF